MTDALERLRAANRHEVTLPSGLAVTIRLPRMRDCVLAGDVPLPVFEALDRAQQAAAAGEDAEPLSAEELRYLAQFQDEVVRAAIVAVEGEAVALTSEDVADLDEADYVQVVAWATRSQPIPKAGEPQQSTLAAVE